MPLDTKVNKLLRNYGEPAKKFLIDTAANYLYWQPLFVLWELGILGYSLNEVITARTGNITLSLFLGRPFGSALDIGRKIIIPGYRDWISQADSYEKVKTERTLTEEETKDYKDLQSKINGPDSFFEMFKKTHLKDTLWRAGADTVSTSVFWNAVFLPWLRYSKEILELTDIDKYSHYIGLSGTNFSMEQLVGVAIGYTALYAIAGAPYGNFLNYFRGVFNKNKNIEKLDKT
jgi:hypothetical protein